MRKLTRREFAILGGAGAVALNSGGLADEFTAANPAPLPTSVSEPVRVNPELQSAVPALEKWMQEPLTNETLPLFRKGTGETPPPPLAHPRWYAQTIPGPRGAPDVKVYVIDPPGVDRLRPAIVHLHGGGFVLGSASDDLRDFQEMSRKLDCLIVSVEYRLAPETPFPGSLEDNYCALKWLYSNASQLRVDRSRIALMGESAGGGHAAMLAIAARDRGEIPLCFQALLCPMLDDRTGSTRKVPPFIGTLVWNAQHNRFGWTALLGKPAGSSKVPYGSVPARIADLRGLPPAFIGVGSIDLFMSEDIEYARRLMEANVPTELHVVPGAYHGFNGIVPNASISRQFNAAFGNSLARAFGETPSTL